MQSENILDKKPPAADQRVVYGPDPNQFADVYLPALRGRGPVPVAFFIHGGYWRAKYDLTHAGHLCAALRKSGFAAWNVEYRRVGNPGGGWPGTFEDLRAAYRLLLKRPDLAYVDAAEADQIRVCVAGHSAGGELALALAAHEPSIRNVISLAGVVNLHRAWELHLSHDAVVEFLGGTPSQVPEHYREASPAEQSISTAVQKIVHGTADDSVPYEISKSYVDQKKKSKENVELITLPDTGHFEVIDPSSAVWPKIEQLFVALTRG